MRATDLLYEGALRVARPVLRVAALRSRKLARGLSGRAEAVNRLSSWAAAERAPNRPLLWFHAPSVGEAFMADVTMRALRRRLHSGGIDPQLVFTFFSPSAESVSRRIAADFTGYLPWDTRADMSRALEALRPAAIVFVRTEIWPTLVREARARAIPCVLINAVLRKDSSRLGPIARHALGPAYRALELVATVSGADAERFARLGVPAERVRVTGDARFDQVWARIHADRSSDGRPDAMVPSIPDGAPALVAGSTWPADEQVVVDAFASARAETAMRLIVAPHEPTSAHLAGLERRLRGKGIASCRLSDLAANDDHGSATDAIIVDRVGVLADLYRDGFAAYVGGGFGNDGLHSVIEPAAHARAVAFGPRVGAAAEALRLERASGGRQIESAPELAHWLISLALDAEQRESAGAAAAAFVRTNLGAAERNARIITDLITGSAGPET